MTRSRLIQVSVVLAYLACPALAAAQPSDTGFVRGLGGVTFGSETSGSVAVGAGASLSRQFDVIGEFGYMRNVLPKEVQEDLDNVVQLLSLFLGVPVSVDLKIPAWYGFGGVRGNVPTGNPVTPFVEGGVGVARLSADITAEAFGIDISDEVAEAADVDAASEFLLSIGGGLNIGFTERVGLDVGYRYTRIFTEDPAINTSSVYAALKFGF